MDLLFCNHAHNGDVFIARGLVADIIQQMPNWRFHYAHFCDSKVMQDIMYSMDTDTAKAIWNDHHFTPFLRLNVNNQIIPALNTWVGAYQGHWPCGHPSYLYLYKIFDTCINRLNQELGFNLKLNPDVWHYITDFDYTKFDLTVADQFLDEHKDKKIYLFSNGRVWSMQSAIDNMKTLIETLAGNHTDAIFLVTEKFDTDIPNIKFTSDIFKMSFDLCEISYLSTKSNIIVGKNSGPFSFSNTKRNLRDASKIFVCFSNYGVDTLPYGLNIAADWRQSNTTYFYYALEILEQAIDDERNKNQISGFKYV